LVGGLRAARPLPQLAASLYFAVALALAPLSIFARLLKDHTHHRPLGAATFAVVAAGLILAALAFAIRVLSFGREPAARRRATIVLTLLAGISLLYALSAAMSGIGQAGAFGAGLVDGGLTLCLGTVAVFWHMPDRRPAAARWFGLPAWLIALFLSPLALSSPPLRARLLAEAPALLAPLWLFVH
jgi:hypothetical protein